MKIILILCLLSLINNNNNYKIIIIIEKKAERENAFLIKQIIILKNINIIYSQKGIIINQ